MQPLRTLICVIAAFAGGWTTTYAAGGADDGDDNPPINVSGRSSVTYYDREGRMQTTTTIPGGSIMRRGGTNDRCTFTAAVDGTTHDDTPYRAGDTVTSTRWVYTERNRLPGTDAPGPASLILDTSGPVPRRLVSIFCDTTNHFLGTVWVSLNDPFWNPRPAAQQLRNNLQLTAPTIYTNPVVDQWGGLITRYPAWLAIDPTAWQPQRSNIATHRGWTIYLYTQPTHLDFRVNFIPDPDQPSPAFTGTVGCVTLTNPATASTAAFPALPTLPDQTEPGVNGPCMWTPPGPGTVTIQATITYQVTLWVNGYLEPQPAYTFTGPTTTYNTGELTAVNTLD